MIPEIEKLDKPKLLQIIESQIKLISELENENKYLSEGKLFYSIRTNIEIKKDWQFAIAY